MHEAFLEHLPRFLPLLNIALGAIAFLGTLNIALGAIASLGPINIGVGAIVFLGSVTYLPKPENHTVVVGGDTTHRLAAAGFASSIIHLVPFIFVLLYANSRTPRIAIALTIGLVFSILGIASSIALVYAFKAAPSSAYQYNATILSEDRTDTSPFTRYDTDFYQNVNLLYGVQGLFAFAIVVVLIWFSEFVVRPSSVRLPRSYKPMIAASAIKKETGTYNAQTNGTSHLGRIFAEQDTMQQQLDTSAEQEYYEKPLMKRSEQRVRVVGSQL